MNKMENSAWIRWKSSSCSHWKTYWPVFGIGKTFAGHYFNGAYFYIRRRAVIYFSFIFHCSYCNKTLYCFTHIVVFNITIAPLQNLFYFNPLLRMAVFSLSKELLLPDDGFCTQHQKIVGESNPEVLKRKITTSDHEKNAGSWLFNKLWFHN